MPAEYLATCEGFSRAINGDALGKANAPASRRLPRGSVDDGSAQGAATKTRIAASADRRQGPATFWPQRGSAFR